MAYLSLKVFNLALATIWSFALIFVLVRVLPVNDYAIVATFTGLGGYVLAVNLGFSSVVYATLRRNFLASGPPQERAMAVATFFVYAAVAALAVIIMATWVLTAKVGSPAIRVGIVVHFTALTCALPWTIVRVSTAAIDKFRFFETVEMIRRAVAVGLVLAMLAGLSFAAYAWLSLLSWAVAFAVTVPTLLALTEGAMDLKAGLVQLRAELPAIRATALFSGLESVIYNFPYALVPLWYGASAAVIAFDTFYKVVRFGASAYLAPAEAMLPAQTKAIHQDDRKGLVNTTVMAILVGAIPMVVGVVAVTIFGDHIFGFLLKNSNFITPGTRFAMAVMLVSMLVQTISGTLLVNTGRAPVLAKISAGITAALVALSVVTAVSKISFDAFITGYAVVFAIGAVVYGGVLVLKFRDSKNGFGLSSAW